MRSRQELKEATDHGNEIRPAGAYTPLMRLRAFGRRVRVEIHPRKPLRTGTSVFTTVTYKTNVLNGAIKPREVEPRIARDCNSPGTIRLFFSRLNSTRVLCRCNRTPGSVGIRWEPGLV